MKRNTILLVVVLIAIFGAILYFESLKPKVAVTTTDADLEIEAIDNQSGVALSSDDEARIAQKAKQFERAKELVDPEGYINVDNITLAENIGKKVIMIDFWTYSCINCQRTLPYITAWDEKYRDDGLLIIGVHTPEFAFEEDYDNVLAAVKKWGIKYPIVQDNDRQTWRAYKNRYWPRKYLIDIDGFIVYDHIGEGAYAETEEEIQKLLAERNEVLGLQEDIAQGTVPEQQDADGISFGRTAEVYFGYKFSRDQLGNSEGWQPEETVSYTMPNETESDMFYLAGDWKNNEDDMELVSDTGRIVLEYHANDVHFVAGSAKPVTIEVYLDGEKTKDVTVQAFDLYTLVENISGYHTLEIIAPKGLMAYTFTFG